jgi:excisionase family DNA binding protein
MSVTSTVTRQTPVEDLPQLLSVEELCAWLGIGRSLGYELVRTQAVHAVRLGRLVRIPRTEVIALTESRPTFGGQRAKWGS